MKKLDIGGFTIHEHSPVFIIAELSANHNGSLETAIATIKSAKKTGADAIKLQTYTADTITIDCDNDYFTLSHGTSWDGKTLYELYREAYTPWEWHAELFRVAKEEGLICFSSPFDASAVDFLESLNCPAYKIASFEIQDIPLIKYVASKGKPVIISTGVADKSDIALAVNSCRGQNNEAIALLKCTSSYPAPIAEADLSMIPDLAQRFDVVAGLSDHTQGIVAPVVATALGARIIEKHIILDKNVGGPDAHFSLDEKEFTEMVRAVRDAERSVGTVNYELSENALENRKNVGRSLFIVRDVKQGEEITIENVRSIRPGHGMHPRHFEEVLGKTFSTDSAKGTPLSLELIKNSNEINGS